MLRLLLATHWPRRVISPQWGRSRPAMVLSSVVLPQPLGPSKLPICPLIEVEADVLDDAIAVEHDANTVQD